MSVKLTIIEQMEQIAREHGKILAPLKEDLVLADCGLEVRHDAFQIGAVTRH